MKKENWICPFCGQGNSRNKTKCEFCKMKRPSSGHREQSDFDRLYHGDDKAQE
jgi:hypothetical protein